MQHKPHTRLGIAFGLVLVLGLILLDVGLVTLALLAPVTPLTVLRVVLVLLTLPVMGIVLYGLVGLHDASYSIERDSLTIRWGPRVQVIPFASMEAVLPGAELGEVGELRGIRWPGCWAGRGHIVGVGAVQFYCTAPLERQLVIKTPSESYAISPENPAEYADLLAARREMGVHETVAQSLAQPRILRAGFFFDRMALLLLAAGAVLSLLLFLLLTLYFGRLPHTLPLHFDLAGAPDRMGSPAELFTLAGLGSLAWAADGLLGYVVYRRLGERMAAYLLWAAAAGLQVLLAVAFLGLVKV